MNSAPDYSAAYIVIRTDAPDPRLSGHGFAFTIGRGNDVQLAAIRLLEPFLADQDLDEVLADLGGLGRRLVSDSPLHWLGSACGVIHMATGAVINACWDLAARRAGKPLWLLFAEMTPEEITGLVDFRYRKAASAPALRPMVRAAGRGPVRRDGSAVRCTGEGPRWARRRRTRRRRTGTTGVVRAGSAAAGPGAPTGVAGKTRR